MKNPTVPIELRHPAIGKRLGRARGIPAEERRNGGCPIVFGEIAAIFGQELEKTGRKEMAMGVGDLHRGILAETMIPTPVVSSADDD
jgi:hypothetical protein